VNNKKLGFIGGGNMARSIINGLIKDDYAAELIYVSDPDSEKLNALKQATGVQTNTDNKELAKSVDILILAMKPQHMMDVLNELAAIIQQRRPLVISIAAGVGTSTIQHHLGSVSPIVRCMPNVPAFVGAGMTGLFATETVSESQRALAESILRAVGATLWVQNEKDIDTITAISGSGPAYFFYFFEALEKAGMDLGLSQADARLLVLQTALGAAQLAMLSDSDAARLREQVTSPGGTTEQALAWLQSRQVDVILQEAVSAARQRAQELSQLLDI
jgi:pyrroline-5-carboxylate reductase